MNRGSLRLRVGALATSTPARRARICPVRAFAKTLTICAATTCGARRCRSKWTCTLSGSKPGLICTTPNDRASTSLRKLACGTPVRRPRASGDPEPAPLFGPGAGSGMNRGRALSPQLLVKITPLPIMALEQLQFPSAAPFLDALFAEDRIGHGLVKFDKH